MDEEDQFLSQVLSGIAEAEIITIFFPLLRRALVIDTRHDEHIDHMIRVMPQVSSMDERIRSIEKLRPQFGSVHSILGIPWMKSVRALREQQITGRLIERLQRAGMPGSKAADTLNRALDQLWRLERLGFERMIKGEGYSTLWAR
ncbi:MAG TPA: hypothetical protein VEX13_13815 [Chloroflexia bacterium]|nr:hypothetical protein [Chloroflexia bacterium]